MYDPSKMDEEVFETAATEKPVRGREMLTKTLPTDKKSLRKPTMFHEGYVDGKMYLVPDSNLEAMRDMVNLKMRPRRSTRYRHQTSYELSGYDHFREKLSDAIVKLDNMPEGSELETTSEESETEQSQSENESTHEKPVEKPEPKRILELDEESEPEEEPEAEEEPAHEKEPESKKPEKIPPTKTIEKDDYYLRFLISGHFKNGMKPIYIIQEYNGKSDIFKEPKADFFSSQTEGDVDINISGRFYNENILEESQGKPVALKTKPEKIMIDEKTSNIYETLFKHTFNMKTVEILVKGQFMKSTTTKAITPYVTLSVLRKSFAQASGGKGLNTYTDKDVKTVLVYQPEYKNPFFEATTVHVGEDEFSKSTESLIQLECFQYETRPEDLTLSEVKQTSNVPVKENSLTNKHSTTDHGDVSNSGKTPQGEGIYKTLKDKALFKSLFKKKCNDNPTANLKNRHIHNTENVQGKIQNNVNKKYNNSPLMYEAVTTESWYVPKYRGSK